MAKSWYWRRKPTYSSTSPPPPPPPQPASHVVPAGHVAVLVGRSRRRFVVRLKDLNHPIIRQLLRHAAEEYGFPSGADGVTLPCDEDLFADVLRHIAISSRPSTSWRSFASFEDFCRLSRSCFSSRAGRRDRDEETLPLLRGN